MRNIYRIAEQNIEITSVYGGVHRLCAEYLMDASADDGAGGASGTSGKASADGGPEIAFSVATDRADIEFERERSAREDEAEGRPVQVWPDSYLETLAVYRKISERLPFYDTFLMHGSCVAVDGQGYMFTAASGTGKSTHTRLWREAFGERAVMINDDKPLIKVNDGGAVVYGTPWDGKHHLSTNTSALLRAVCILERGSENEICEISFREAYPMLLQQSYRPMDREALVRTLELIERLPAAVGFYRMKCNMEPAAAHTAFEKMSGG